MKSRWHCISTVVILLSYNSCEENFKNNEKLIPIELQPYENQLAFVDENLKTLGQLVLSMASDPEFRNIVYDQIEKRVDDEHNVLIETLSKVQMHGRETIGARINDLTNLEESIEETLDKFRGIEGRDMYPQIYIPFYENAKARKRVRALSKETLRAENPVLVIYDGNETGDENPVYTGYQLNENGELTESSVEIDEEYASQNEVWVISLNERIEDIDVVENSTTETMTSKSFRMNKLKCKCHKESWIAGASEVNIISFMSGYGFSNLQKNLYGGNDHQGGYLIRVRRFEIKYENWIDMTYQDPIVRNWDERYTNAEYVHYVIFEYDVWPTGKRKAIWEQGGRTLEWSYRSSDGYYDKKTVFKSYFALDAEHHTNNNCIEWIGKLRN